MARIDLAQIAHRLRPSAARLPAAKADALLIVAAVAIALIWSNGPWRGTYDAFWHAPVALTTGPFTLGADLRTWIDEAVMTAFFLVTGLEVKRERDLGELRDGRRLTAPVLAALGGIVASVAVYLAITAGGPGAHGWGVALSTDSALALGTLSLAAGARAARLRVFLLTLLVVDDVVALLVVSAVYPDGLRVGALAAAFGFLVVMLAIRAIAARQLRDSGDSNPIWWPLTILVAVGLWIALFRSGVDPVVSGLLIGLLTNASLPEAARPATSPNDRLLTMLQPWNTRVVVPLFALANAGLHVDGTVLGAAATSPVTWAIVLAYLAGKPAGVLLGARAAGTRTAGLAGTAMSTGVGFTLALLIAARAFDGALLDQAKVGILATVLLAPVLSTAVARAARTRRRTQRRARVRVDCRGLHPAPAVPR